MRKLCKNCFSERKSRTCPVCGYSGGGGNNTGNALKRGTRLAGRYTVGGVIGSGSFGITYIAYDLKNDTVAAVKEYFPRLIAVREGNSSVRASSEKYGEIYRHGAEEFYREAEYVFQFNGNPNIVSVSDYFYENNTSYVVMEYLFGITLERYVKNYGTLTDAQTVYTAEKILMALIAVHSAQLLHRDISPDNIMLCADGKIKLIDFGAARQFTADSLPELTVIMKNGFSPAEQYMRNGSFGEWTDIYSLGAVLYYAVTGNVPENPYERMISDGELDFYGKSTDHALQEIICKAVSISKAKRYKSAAEMKKAVSELKTKGEGITFPDNFEPFKIKSFSATAPNGYSVRKKSKYLSDFAIGALAVSAFFVFGMTVQNMRNEQTIQAMDSENTAVPDEEKKEISSNTETVSEIQSAESSTPKTPVKIAFDGEQKSPYEFDGNIPSAVLRDFGGDVEITYNFTLSEDAQTTGIIPADSDGNYLIKYITGDYIFAQPHGYIDVKNGDYIDINDDVRSLSFTLSREGVESLGDNDFGIYNYNLILDSAEIKSGVTQAPISFDPYMEIDYLEPIVSEENSKKIVFADLTDTDGIIKHYPNEFGSTTWAVPKFAFEEFSGDVLVKLRLEHSDNADSHVFYITDCGMNPQPTFKSVILGEEKDKFGNYFIHYFYNGVSVSENITECSFVIPRKAVEDMLGGIYFGEDDLIIKSVRLESADKEVEYGNVSN